jgi:hypothetical protein
MNAAETARKLGGEVSGRDTILCPGPGHSPKDRSLAVKLVPTAPDGFVVHSHAGDNWRECRDHVRERLSLPRWEPGDDQRRTVPPHHVDKWDLAAVEAEAAESPRAWTEDEIERISAARRIWEQAQDPRGTLAERYLREHRLLDLPDDLIGGIARFHSSCPWRNEDTGKTGHLPTLVVPFRSVDDDAITGIHRIALKPFIAKPNRRMRGVVYRAAIKLDPISEQLAVGEGVETCMAAREMGYRPVWALGSTGNISFFPIIEGVKTLLILGERGDASAEAINVCGTCWRKAGRRVRVVMPDAEFSDLNDVLMAEDAVTVHEYDFKGDDDAQSKSRIYLIPFDEIQLGTEGRYLIKGLIPRTGLVVVWGPPKSGKSFKIFDMLLHVALNRRYRGRRVHSGPVVYCSFEGQTGFEARCAAFRKKFLARNKDHVPFYLQPVTLDLIKEAAELIRVIQRTLGNVRPVVIALDTLNRSLRGSESSDEDMSAYIRAADSLREAFDCAVIIVHHCGLDGNRPRGHTSLTGAADAQLSVSRDVVGNIDMTVEYMKDGAEGDRIVSRLEQIEVGADEDGEPITSCIVVPADMEDIRPNIKVPQSAKLALNVLNEVITDSGEVVSGGSIPPNTRTIPVVRWREVCESKMIADSEKPDSKYKAFVRASKRLQALKIIAVWNDRVWVVGQAGQART